MPELPEVETVVREIRPGVLGRRLVKVWVSDRPLRRLWRTEWGPLLEGRKVQEVGRRGKWIVLGLDRDLYLVVHLGMTGNLTVADAAEPAADHTHLVVDLRPGRQQLRFRDIRRFGSATLFHSRDELEQSFEKSGLGPEPFDLDVAYFRQRLAATDRCLKAVLLDQRVVAGVGNIYADESLYEAKLSPRQSGRSTTPAQASRLQRAVATVLSRAIERRGSSIRNYVGGSGLRGEYQNEFRAYGRVGQPCRRCGTAIERIRLAGRSTYYCPRCQAV